ncbi:MAG: threonine--tRNA ligase [Alphaproteobacteria bacterium]
MIHIRLLDNTVRSFETPLTAADVAGQISPRLLKEALAAKVDGVLVDLSYLLTKDATLEIVTKTHADALEIIRHDTAHLLAEAAKEIYGDNIQITIGPAIENGFYYDFALDTPFTPDDLEALEKKMRAIVDRNEDFVREEWDRDEAVAYFKKMGENYKAEIINDLPKDEKISLYRQGKFLDLCRGPHAPSTGKVGKAFKLLKVAGAYWRGDSKNAMLQRIYGTAWATEQQLKDYLFQLEEAEKRDHRKLGREMDLFHMQEEAVGSVFWHPKGWRLYRTLQNYIRHKLEQNDYQEINTPLLLDRKLWEASGHWEKFKDNMFALTSSDDRMLALKPMSCPCHVQVFKQGLKSYRDLPLRLAEFGCCHRNEPSGGLHGIMRVRNFVQDDGHVFCTVDQILDESKKFCTLLKEVYTAMGFPDFNVRFSDRPAVRAGDDAAWDKAESMMKNALEEMEISYAMNPGEGAFYGPKLEFILRDAVGREWQCGTLQLDFVLPERLDASYMGEDGCKHRPVMLHRAILGTFERFIGILIEHYAGKFPLWMAPTQAVIAPIVTQYNPYAEKIAALMEQAGLRAELDLRNEKINYKIREHSLAKVPYILIVGDREQADNTVTLRKLGDTNQETLALPQAIDKLRTEACQPC